MSTTDRQNRLLLAEDWKRVYQTFKTADFKSYDFDSLRRTMISYLRENYPEDFNDYIESSEYLALIDLIAYLGQNMAFRVDLNARENFLELAERRESVLRLARLLSYNPKRNQAANGLLKFESVQTTEQINDTNGVNLSGQTILWNDPSNPDWAEQFRKILNAALPEASIVGKPVKKETIAGITTEQYRFNASNSNLPIYSFNKNVGEKNIVFEITSATIDADKIFEEDPLPGNSLGFLYREDGKGAGSSNSGYFVHFRQGVMDTGNFSIDNPTTNQAVAIDTTNINNSDVWLYRLDSNGNEQQLWTKVDAVEGNNVIYNSVSKSNRSLYAVQSRIDDRISLLFADGTFGDLPKGNFRCYFRKGIGTKFTINPEDLTNVTISVPYTSRAGTAETFTFVASLKYTVDNASGPETNKSIKENAPSTYYTQNRMITGEDYNVAPRSVSQEVVKVKSINRTSSGISRYFDLIDSTGKYSSTNIFGNDGAIYKDVFDKKVSFSFATKTDVEGKIQNIVTPLLSDSVVKNFFLNQFPKISTADLQADWTQVAKQTNNSSGYIADTLDIKLTVGAFTGSTLKYLEPGAIVKFVAPPGKHFMKDNSHALMDGDADHPSATKYLWTKVIRVNEKGTENYEDGQGPIIFNDVVPTGALLDEIKPKFATNLTTDVTTQMIDQIFAYKTFGLRYSTVDREWRVILNNNLSIGNPFNMGKTGDVSGQNLDSSWLMLFETDGEKYTITYRGVRYIFESNQEVKFYFDETDKIYDSRTGQIVRDKINIMSINKKPDSSLPETVDYPWQVTKEFRDDEGYVNSKKVEVGFFDSDGDGVVDNPDLFDAFVAQDTNPLTKYIFLKERISNNQSTNYDYVDAGVENIRTFLSETSTGALSQYDDGTLFYFTDADVFKVYNKANANLTLKTGYKAYQGRDKLVFQYVHSADENNRLDPSSSNIVDTYLLTKTYDKSFRQYLADTIPNKPLPPSSDELFQNFGAEINKIKSISDEVIYHPVNYKILFGNKADPDLQATFKVVKNPEVISNDNDIKLRIIQAINEFFSLEFWDFGDKFSFTELSTYIINSLAPDITTLVLVPNQTEKAFGSLYEISTENDEIFISGATVDDVEIIDSITASRLKTSGTVVTTASTENAGITSSANTVSTTTTTSTSTSSSSSSSSSSGNSGSGNSGGY
tara:strand:- start:21890 stop:25417 length:3528 start_codon:yes stop_codon:yes gene_type:complete